MLSPEGQASPDTAVEFIYQKLRDSLRASLASDTPMTGLQSAVAELVAETRRFDRQAEHAVAVLKRAWNDMPADLRPKSVTPGRTPLLERLVTMTIEAYYARRCDSTNTMP